MPYPNSKVVAFLCGRRSAAKSVSGLLSVIIGKRVTLATRSFGAEGDEIQRRVIKDHRVGLGEMDLSSVGALIPSVKKVQAARWPPAEPPAATMRLGSYSELSSATTNPAHGADGVLDAFVGHGAIPGTKSIIGTGADETTVGEVFGLGLELGGVPVVQPPPKKKTMAGRLSDGFQSGG